MSGVADDRELLAAEFVLGTLSAAEARMVEEQAAHDPELAAIIMMWQERFAPMAALTASVPPPPELRARILAAIDALNTRPISSSRLLVRVWESIVLWRATAVTAAAAAAVLAGLLVLRPPAPAEVAALVPYGDTAAVFVGEVLPNGRLLVRALGPVDVAPDQALQLWALPIGATRPVSLGLLPIQGRELNSPPSQAQLLISLEPRGGSPTGLPTGRVLYAGSLIRPR